MYFECIQSQIQINFVLFCIYKGIFVSFYEDDSSNLVDERGEEATAFVEEKSFCLNKLADLRKYIKNQEVQIETTPADTVMEETTSKKERNIEYNVYTNKDRRCYFIQNKIYEDKRTLLT